MIFPLRNDLDMAKHEFGHHFLARHGGFETVDVKLTPAGGGSEIVTDRKLETVDEVAAFAEDRIRVLYAGVMAESVVNGKVDQTITIQLINNEAGKGDFMLGRQLVALIRNTRHMDLPLNPRGDAMEADERRLWDETIVLVEKYTAGIDTMATQLLVQGGLTFAKTTLDRHSLIRQYFP
ncbi:MAG: hypothetical protein JWQ89_1641 [Devosia sp.]|uniref:hypothetical protein n=1 Tax=Devosia sp. TaxID=1871048 RepID=UPI0026286150|nr:hypothetical protein [Devosia sp.]MDB5539914.1 hypothetical protein [Devosia sp.]